jgi:hypothetical protein
VTEMARGGESYGPRIEKLRSHPATTLRGHLPCGCNEEHTMRSRWCGARGNTLGIGIFPNFLHQLEPGNSKTKKPVCQYCWRPEREPSNELRPTTTSNWSPLHQWACLTYASSHLTRLRAKVRPSFGATCLHNPSFVRHRPFCRRAWVSFLEGTTSILAETSPYAVLDKTCRWGK